MGNIGVRNSWKVIILCCLLHCLSHVNSQAGPLNKTEREAAELHMKKEQIIVDGLLDGYDKRFIPAKPGKPLNVDLKISVSDVLALDDNAMESDMLIFIRQIWYDYRLSWGNGSERVKVREHLLDKIWLPDVRMSNLKDMKRFDGFGGINMNIHSNGRVYFSQLALVKISCPMDLRNFPMDKQTCFLNFSSYAYAKTLMFFTLVQRTFPIKHVDLPQFDFHKAEEIVHDPKSSSNVPKVTVAIVFKRRIGYYIIQIYIPSVFLVVLSWLAFLMEPTNIADRLSLEVTMILSIVFLHGGVNTTIPKVSYAKASDWYVITSFLFIFMALLETMLVYRIKSKTLKTKEKSVTSGIRKYLSSISGLFNSTQNGQVVTVIAEGDNPTLDPAPVKRPSAKNRHTFWVDKVCLIAFPSLYIVFNVAYWAHYL